MIEKKRTRHFHAGKLRKTVGGIEFVEVAESKGKVFVSAYGTLLTRGHMTDAWYFGVPMKNGYREVCVSGSPALVHRIVYEVFVGAVEDGIESDHIDADPENNKLINLRAVTSKENSANPITRKRMLRALSVSIVKAQSANLTPVIGISGNGLVAGPFSSMKDAATFAGVSLSAISACVRGKSKTSGGYQWKEVSNV